MKYVLETFLILALLLSACSEAKVTEQTETEVPVQKEVIPDNEIDNLMLEIDAKLAEMPQVKSLRYSKEDQTITDVTAWLDENNQIQKMEEYHLDGPTGIITRKHFYSNGGALYATRMVQEKRPVGKDPYFSEVVTFYDQKGKPSSSKERIAQFEELLEQEGYSKIETNALSSENAMMILNQQGPYETTFQGFVHSGSYSFLIVGENSADGYTSSLSIQSQSPTINYLMQQGKAALGRKLQVNFDRFVDAQGYEMQILVDLALVEEKKK